MIQRIPSNYQADRQIHNTLLSKYISRMMYFYTKAYGIDCSYHIHEYIDSVAIIGGCIFFGLCGSFSGHYNCINGLMQERRNSSALAMELHLSCINPSIYIL